MAILKKSDDKAKRLLKKWLNAEKTSVIVLSIGNVLLSQSAVFFSLGSKEIVDSAIANNTRRLIGSTIFLVSIAIFMIILKIILSNISQNTTARMSNSVRQEFLSRIMNKEFLSVSGYHSGDLVNRAFSDVAIISGGVTGIIPPLCGMITKLISATITLWLFDWRYTLIMFALGILVMCGSFLTKRSLKSMHKEVQNDESIVHAVFQEILGNLKFIKSSGSEGHMESLAQYSQDNFYQSQMRRKRYMLLFEACYNSVMEFCWLTTLIWGAFSIHSGMLTYGMLMAMTQLMGQMQSPLSSIPALLQRYYTISASAERLEELFELPDENYNTPLADNISLESVTVNGVLFSYDRNQVLEHISATIHLGDFVAITGLSGGGKSTLFLLLLGIYAPKSGEINFNFDDGTVLHPCASTRKLFAYVPQGNVIFSGSIRDNLLMFNPASDDATLMQAAKIACIDTFIKELPDKLDTRVGERGLGLSEGQAQRIAIARAIVGDASVLLLDESTSALDEETEARLLRNLSSLKDITCLIVTHRKAALGICNKQLHMENGIGTLSDIINA